MYTFMKNIYRQDLFKKHFLRSAVYLIPCGKIRRYHSYLLWIIVSNHDISAYILFPTTFTFLLFKNLLLFSLELTILIVSTVCEGQYAVNKCSSSPKESLTQLHSLKCLLTLLRAFCVDKSESALDKEGAGRGLAWTKAGKSTCARGNGCFFPFSFRRWSCWTRKTTVPWKNRTRQLPTKMRASKACGNGPSHLYAKIRWDSSCGWGTAIYQQISSGK